MPKLEFFFDYACPYCLRGHEHLLDLIPQFEQIEIMWIPCEAHPRPDRYGMHSDLCAQGMYFALENGVDIYMYHELMYSAALKRRINIEDADALAEYAVDLLDPVGFRAALNSKRYESRLLENNRLAWGVHRFSAVPSCIMGGRTLVSVEDIGISKESLKRFFVSIL